MNLRGAVAIAGIGETPVGKVPQRSSTQLHVDAIESALQDAGLELNDVDLLMTGNSRPRPYLYHAEMVAEYLGIYPAHCLTVNTGGSTSAALIQYAAAMIATGQAEVAVIAKADNLATGMGAGGGAMAGAAVGAMGGPVGMAAGAAVGALAGGMTGKGVSRMMNPKAEDSFWRDNYKDSPGYVAGYSYDDYAPAYRTGYESYGRSGGASFDASESTLRSDWERAKGSSRLTWEQAKGATRAA